MTVSSNWQSKYEELEKFISVQLEIRIEPNRVSIPDSIRADFYHLFDTVTTAIVQAHYSTLPATAAVLCDSYRQVEKQVTSLLSVAGGVAMPTSLNTFLHNPKQGLANALFDEVFALLQGKIDRETFEQRAIGKLETTVNDLSCLGYPYWASLSVVRLLEPDLVFQVALDSAARPILKEPRNIPFGRPAPHPTLRLPELIIHSRRINKYLALKLELASEIGTYTTHNRGERKQAMRNFGETCSILGPRVMLLYVLAQPEPMPIVADLATRQVYHPDVTIECPGQLAHEWEEVKQRYDVLQPTRGTYLVFRESVPEPCTQQPCAHFYPLVVDLDPGKLEPVIGALI